MGKKKIVLDTNILISAFGWKGKPREIYEKVLEKEFELIISKKQIEELERVLNYPKFDFDEDKKARFLAILMETATIVETSDNLKIIEEDPDDNVILESAVESNVSFLVSGDPHLLEIKKFGEVEIISAAEFLEKIKKKFKR